MGLKDILFGRGIAPESSRREPVIDPFSFDLAIRSTDSGLTVDMIDWERRLFEWIMGHKDEILTAFVAKYGCGPDEVEMVHQVGFGGSGSRWYVRKRETKDAAK